LNKTSTYDGRDEREYFQLLSSTANFTHEITQKKDYEITIAVNFEDKEEIGMRSEPDYMYLYLWGLPDLKNRKGA